MPSTVLPAASGTSHQYPTKHLHSFLILFQSRLTPSQCHSIFTHTTPLNSHAPLWHDQHACWSPWQTTDPRLFSSYSIIRGTLAGNARATRLESYHWTTFSRKGGRGRAGAARPLIPRSTSAARPTASAGHRWYMHVPRAPSCVLRCRFIRHLDIYTSTEFELFALKGRRGGGGGAMLCTPTGIPNQVCLPAVDRGAWSL